MVFGSKIIVYGDHGKVNVLVAEMESYARELGGNVQIDWKGVYPETKSKMSRTYAIEARFADDCSYDEFRNKVNAKAAVHETEDEKMYPQVFPLGMRDKCKANTLTMHSNWSVTVPHYAVKLG
jgi:hypothetical protein